MNTYSTILRHGFVAGVTDVKKLIDILQCHIGKVSIVATCEDDIYREFETFEDLVSYENPKSKGIRHLDLSARSSDASQSAAILLYGSFWSGISIKCTGNPNVVSIFKGETLDVIAGMKPWYDLIHPIYTIRAFFAVLFVLLAISLLSLFADLALEFKWGVASDFNGTTTRYAQIPRGVLNAILIPLFFITLFIDRLYNFFFPRAVFTIGQGESRFRQQERVQWGVIVAFFVSIFAGITIVIVKIIFR